MRRVLRHAEKKSTDITLLSENVALPDRSLMGNSLLGPLKQVYPSPTSVVALNENTNTSRPGTEKVQKSVRIVELVIIFAALAY